VQTVGTIWGFLIGSFMGRLAGFCLAAHLPFGIFSGLIAVFFCTPIGAVAGDYAAFRLLD
jgi:hypothetical protein